MQQFAVAPVLHFITDWLKGAMLTIPQPKKRSIESLLNGLEIVNR